MMMMMMMILYRSYLSPNSPILHASESGTGTHSFHFALTIFKSPNKLLMRLKVHCVFTEGISRNVTAASWALPGLYRGGHVSCSLWCRCRHASQEDIWPCAFLHPSIAIVTSSCMQMSQEMCGELQRACALMLPPGPPAAPLHTLIMATNALQSTALHLSYCLPKHLPCTLMDLT